MATDPPNSKAFTPEEDALIASALNRYNSVCAVCKSSKWIYFPYVSMALTGLPGSAIPLLPVACTCGNILFMNMRYLGLDAYLKRIGELG